MTRLIDIADIEGAILDIVKQEPEKAPKYAKILKEIKQVAGVLAHDQVITPSINVKELRVLMAHSMNVANVSEKSKKRLSDT